jgi:pimeloyl-ACP methyl ester carboxylesterase
MAEFVLVPGAWLGGWAWREVAARLRERGHEAHAVTLTGLGDRAHLASPAVDLDAHVADVVATVLAADLRDVVLVGHSYGCAPVTGAAVRLGDRLARLVYVDAAPIPDDCAYLDASPPEVAALIGQLVNERGDGWRLPMPDWDTLETAFGAKLDGLGEAVRQRIRHGAVDHPFAAYSRPLRLGGGKLPPALPKTAVLTSFSLADVRALMASGHPWGAGMTGPEWTFVELPTGHWPMFSRPRDLADELDRLATNRALQAN